MTADVHSIDDYEILRQWKSLNELQQTYGMIRAGCYESAVGRYNRLAIEKLDYKRGRPIDIKRSFQKAVECFVKADNKPVNDECVEKIELFFAHAALSKFQTLDDVASFLGQGVTSQLLADMGSMAKAQHATNEKRRTKGRELRVAIRRGWS